MQGREVGAIGPVGAAGRPPVRRTGIDGRLHAIHREGREEGAKVRVRLVLTSPPDPLSMYGEGERIIRIVIPRVQRGISRPSVSRRPTAPHALVLLTPDYPCMERGNALSGLSFRAQGGISRPSARPPPDRLVRLVRLGPDLTPWPPLHVWRGGTHCQIVIPNVALNLVSPRSNPSIDVGGPATFLSALLRPSCIVTIQRKGRCHATMHMPAGIYPPERRVVSL